jgi:hypothetical protein
MRKLLLASAALAIIAIGPARAADMALKNPPAPAPVPFTAGASDWYWGVGSFAGVAQSNVSTTNLFATSLATSNLTASGGGISAELGYLHGSIVPAGFGNWWRFNAEASYQNIAGGISVPGNSASVASRWSATQEFDVGADVVTYIMSALGPAATVNFPTFTPQLPQNVAVGMPKQYFGAILREFGLDGQVGAAHGVSVGVAPGVAGGFIFPTLNASGQPNGGAIDLFASVTWTTKGATLNNVLAANGTPLSINNGIDEGTTYLTGIRILRGF